VSFEVFIPARYASTRLPGKPLLDIAGKPLIQRVHERACAAGAERVVIATDDERIRAAAEAFGARVCMTAASHVSGTDRIAEAAETLGVADETIIVNVQSDEPQVPGAVIAQLAALLAGCPGADMATLCVRIVEAQELLDPNVVKVVADAAGYALYFSRAPIPWPGAFPDRPGGAPDVETWRYERHLGLYAYRARFLRRYRGLAPCEAERIERLEQLRALHHGARIRIAQAAMPVPPGVDSEADLERVRRDFGAAAGASPSAPGR
jgi:3-deoxy-manno-octulosonate cytidylyltransferase (CMP-KDO synthetase)